MNENGIDTAARLREVGKAIMEHADQFNMKGWFMYVLEDGATPGGCGTAACIGGWAFHLFEAKSETLRESDRNNWSFTPPKILGIDGAEGARLFHVAVWPRQYADPYYRAKTAKERAQIANERIEHFIATQGKE